MTKALGFLDYFQSSLLFRLRYDEISFSAVGVADWKDWYTEVK